MKIKTASIPELLDGLEEVYEFSMNETNAQSLHDRRKAILRELFFRNENEYLTNSKRHDIIDLSKKGNDEND